MSDIPDWKVHMAKKFASMFMMLWLNLQAPRASLRQVVVAYKFPGHPTTHYVALQSLSGKAHMEQ